MNLKIENLHKFYGTGDARVEVLKGVNAEIPSGRIAVLLGPSGSGKSTLLNILGGIEPMDEGSILIGDRRIEAMDEKSLTLYRRDNLGFVFQFYNLIPNLTIKENIETGAYLSKSPLDIDELLVTLGLEEHKDKFPSQVSGGQQQRCAIGRAIVKNPSILLCDEPTGALDYKTSKEILELIEKVNRKYNNTIIIVTHNEAVKNMAHIVLKMRDGVIYRSYVNETIVNAADLEW